MNGVKNTIKIKTAHKKSDDVQYKIGITTSDLINKLINKSM